MLKYYSILDRKFYAFIYCFFSIEIKIKMNQKSLILEKLNFLCHYLNAKGLKCCKAPMKLNLMSHSILSNINHCIDIVHEKYQIYLIFLIRRENQTSA